MLRREIEFAKPGRVGHSEQITLFAPEQAYSAAQNRYVNINIKNIFCHLCNIHGGCGA